MASGKKARDLNGLIKLSNDDSSNKCIILLKWRVLKEALTRVKLEKIDREVYSGHHSHFIKIDWLSLQRFFKCINLYQRVLQLLFSELT